MRYLILLGLMAFLLSCQGSGGDAGPTGPQSDPGAEGATGPTGERGTIGLTGATGTTGRAGENGDCSDIVAPEIGEITITDTTEIDGTYQIDIPVTYIGYNPISYTFVGTGGLFYRVDGESPLKFIFEPRQSGPIPTTINVTDGCQVVSRSFEINVREGWRYTGPKEFSNTDTHYTSLYIDQGTPYVAFARNGSAYPNEFHIQVLRLKSGSIWEDLGFEGVTRIGADFKSLGLSVYDRVPYVAFVDAANDHQVTLRRYISDDAGTEAAGGDGSWETYETGIPFSNGAEWIALQVYQGIPYVAHSRNTGSSPGLNGTYTTVSHYNAGTWEHLEGTDRFHGYNPSLSVEAGTPYVAFQRLNGENMNINLYRIKAGVWEEMTYPTQGPFENGLYPNIVVDNGIPYLAYYYNGAGYNEVVVRRDRLESPGTWDELTFPLLTFYEAYDFKAAAYPPQLFIHQGIPHVAYITLDNNALSVVKYVPSTGGWLRTFESGRIRTVYARDLSLFIDQGVPYVAYGTNLYDQTIEEAPQYYIGNLIKLPLETSWLNLEYYIPR